MKAAAYLRVSSAERRNQNDTIANQRAFHLRHCEQAGIKLLKVYEDNDVSGKIPMERRPAGKEMMQDARAGLFDTLLVYRIDRLGRNTVDSLQVVAQLRPLGVSVVSLTEPIDMSGPMGEFTFTVFAAVAQMEASSITERVMLGKVEAARAGRWTGGRLPYGYLVQEKVLVPHPQQAPIVRRMFSLYRSGLSLPDIAHTLNAEVIPAPGGDKWHWKTVNRIVQNRLYCGEATYRKTRMLRENGEYAGWERQPEENHIHFAVPPLITVEEFEATQMVREGRPRTGKRGRHYPFYLSGKVVCVRCDGVMHANCQRKPNGAVYPYYRCPSCKKQVNARLLDDDAWGYAVAVVGQPERLLKILRESEPPSNSEETERLEREIASKQKEKERTISVFTKGIIEETDLEKQMARIEKETLHLFEQLETSRSAQIRRLNLQREIDTLEEILKAPDCEERRKKLVQQLTVSARVDKEEAVISYKSVGEPDPALKRLTIIPHSQQARVLQGGSYGLG